MGIWVLGCALCCCRPVSDASGVVVELLHPVCVLVTKVSTSSLLSSKAYFLKSRVPTEAKRGEVYFGLAFPGVHNYASHHHWVSPSYTVAAARV